MIDKCGMSDERASLMGMPHVGVIEGNGYLTMEPNARCVICGMPANNKHHVVPKGAGGGNRVVNIINDEGLGMFPVRSPLFAVCGFGNASGCHGEFTANRYSVKWIWDDEQMKQDWESGDLLAHGWRPHDVRLWTGGHYVIKDTHDDRVYVIDRG